MTYRIDLVVPGLCGPLPGLDGLETAARPLLETLRGAERRTQPVYGYERQLGALFGVGGDDVPASAACCLLGHGIEPGAEPWIHAEPVYMQADMGHAVMFDSHTLAIEEDEAAELVELFNAHFAADGVSLVRAGPTHWYMRLTRGGIETTPIADAVGRNVNLYLPRGDEASFWRALMNETQMLFHGSEVNTRREARGLSPVNSLWLWGEGSLPAAGRHEITRVYADDVYAHGLARLHGVPAEAPPADGGALCARQQAGARAVLVLKSMHWPASYGDADAWLQALPLMQQDWLSPLLQAARRDRAQLTLYPCNGISYGMRNRFRLRFWRRDRLSDYVDTRKTS